MTGKPAHVAIHPTQLRHGNDVKLQVVKVLYI
jgi:hypothetical protein